ncbi:MAG TPA: hypothetical protein IAD26_04430 [Candidatus Limenecus avicola]|uniref:Uncharacterized protein n=1 Tax=Candidatus Limenecus avicola TaxID=2840847 RepID=A0A9D1SQT2_9CLOT|nr:hypothetical protein [Candidatus Limenecus avicola]
MTKNNNNRNANQTTAGVNPSGRLSFKANPMPIAKTFGEKMAVNKYFNKFLDILADNSLIADALIALGLTTIARPASIYVIPAKDEQEKKKNNYQVAHSIATGVLGLATTIAVAEPIKRGVKKLMKNPEKYMKNDASYIKNNERVFKETAGRLHQPIFLPLRAALTIMIVKPILESLGLSKDGHATISAQDKAKMDFSFMSFKGLNEKKTFNRFTNINSSAQKNNKNVAFKGAGSAVTEGIAKGVGKIADTKGFRKFIEWFKEKNQWFPHLIAAESLWLSGFYMQQTAKSKKIEKDQKLPMILNQGITAVLCTIGAYKLDGVINKKLDKYKDVYKRMNPQLEEKVMNRRLTGIRLLGPIVIFTTIYRFVGPVLVTPIANKISEMIEPHNKKAA